MPRLYSGFPARAPGAGLLLLRIAMGATLVAQALPCLSDVPDPTPAGIALCLLGLLSGASLIVGFLTRIVAAVACTLVAGITFLSLTTSSITLLHDYLFCLNVIVITIAITLLGPGAISLDAMLFGRRKVIIPRS